MSDRLKEAVERVLEAVLGPRIDRCALYPARVVAQSASDGTLEVQFDDTRFPSMTKVPIRTPFPQTTVKVQAGARVLIGWEATEEARGPDPRRPYAALWESGSFTELVLGGVSADFVALAAKVDGELNKISLTLESLTGGSGAPAEFTVPYSRAGVGATKVKAE